MNPRESGGFCYRRVAPPSGHQEPELGELSSIIKLGTFTILGCTMGMVAVRRSLQVGGQEHHDGTRESKQTRVDAPRARSAAGATAPRIGVACRLTGRPEVPQGTH